MDALGELSFRRRKWQVFERHRGMQQHGTFEELCVFFGMVEPKGSHIWLKMSGDTLRLDLEGFLSSVKSKLEAIENSFSIILEKSRLDKRAIN